VTVSAARAVPVCMIPPDRSATVVAGSAWRQ
jgi:hypothetical protein